VNALSPREGAVTAEAADDLEVARTVGLFVAAVRPAVAGARLLSGLAGLTPIPLVNAYPRRDGDGRTDWWVAPIGSVSTIAVAWPGALGPLVRWVPIQPLLGFANQTLLVVGISGEHGVTGFDEQVDLAARVLVRRHIVSRELIGDRPRLSVLVPVTAEARAARSGVRAAVATVGRVRHAWRAANLVVAARPVPPQVFGVLGRLPFVGAVASYVGELSTLGAVAGRTADGAKILGLESAFSGPAGA
jgi:hypothetical protein